MTVLGSRLKDWFGRKNAVQEPAPPTPEQRFWELVGSLPPERSRQLARELLASSLEPEEYGHIPSLERRTTPPLNTWRVQNEQTQWDIAPDARVLDVGSGGWPFSRATHLADLYPEETSHRVERLKRDDRPFAVVDIHRLPYPDHSFDFVFCSHVLEHLDDPGKAIRELQRVARAGYIEVPTRLSDVMFNFTRLENHHRWHGLNLGGKLALIEWSSAERRDLGSSHFFKMAHSSYENPFQSFLEKNWDFFFTRIHWTGHIPFIVISNTGEILDAS